MPSIIDVLLILIAVLAAALVVCLVRALFIKKPATAAVRIPLERRNPDHYAQTLSDMVRCATVSNANFDYSESIREFHKVLEKTFPLFHSVAEKTDIGGNLLFKWSGSGSDKLPALFMAHQDVVEATGEWSHGAFSGDIADGRVWGRGTLDSKCNICGLLNAAEELMRDGFTPERDIYFAFGCTEEIGGNGAPMTAAYLKERGLRFELILDEGGSILTKTPFPGIKDHFAMIGIMEKGIGNFRFTAKSNGGHSSTPGKNTPIARLAAFVNRMETRSPFKMRVTKPVRDMLARFAPYMSFGMRFFAGNMWLFGGVFALIAPAVSREAAAMLRTTWVFTMAQGSRGYNVIPESAEVIANSRFMVHQNMAQTLETVKKIADRYDLETELIEGANDCSPVSDITTDAYKFIENTILGAFPNTGVAPYVVLGGTDARFYTELSPTVLRFAPYVMDSQQMNSCHAKDENISIDALADGVGCYRYILKNF